LRDAEIYHNKTARVFQNEQRQPRDKKRSFLGAFLTKVWQKWTRCLSESSAGSNERVCALRAEYEGQECRRVTSQKGQMREGAGGGSIVHVDVAMGKLRAITSRRVPNTIPEVITQQIASAKKNSQRDRFVISRLLQRAALVIWQGGKAYCKYCALHDASILCSAL
jgi:hypothetical protein